MKMPLRGIIPPVITPLLSDSEIDMEGLYNLIRHLVSGGVHGLFLLGTTGEATSLQYKTRENVVKRSCDLVAGKIPVMAGITDTSFESSVEMAYCYKEAGADVVVVAPPYYIPVSQPEMIKYLEDLSAKLPLPFILYNIPGYTKHHLSVETVNRARELGALGIKDSSGDMLYLYSLIEKFKNFPGFSVITGTEMFIPETIIRGGHGAVAGGANMFPRLFTDLYEASITGDFEKIKQLQQIVIKIYCTVYNLGEYNSRFITGTKCALSVMGICNGYVAHPLSNFQEEDKRKMEKYIQEIEESLMQIKS